MTNGTNRRGDGYTKGQTEVGKGEGERGSFSSVDHDIQGRTQSPSISLFVVIQPSSPIPFNPCRSFQAQSMSIQQTNKQTTCTTATKLIHKPTIQQSSIPPFIRKQHLQSNNLLIPKCPTIGLIYYSIPSPITQLLLAIQQHSRHKRRFCLGLGSITTLPHQRSWYRRCRCRCRCGRS